MIPYGTHLGVSSLELSLLPSIKVAVAFTATFWVPLISDKHGRFSAMFLCLVTLSCSHLTFLIAGWVDTDGFVLMCVANIIAGLCGHLIPHIMDLIVDISDGPVLQRRMTVVRACNQAFGILLSPLAGIQAKYISMQFPFGFSAVTSGLCTMLALLMMLESLASVLWVPMQLVLVFA